MRKQVHLNAVVLPGGRIEVESRELTEGEHVEITISGPEQEQRRSIVDILAEAPGQRLFKTPEDVEKYLKEERGL